MPVIHQLFAEVKHVDRSFLHMKYDGLFGLAFTSMAKNNVPAPVEQMKRQGVIEQSVFSFCLYKRPNNKKSVLIVGGSDKTLYNEPMHFIPLSAHGFWEFRMHRIVIRNYMFCSHGCETILDSGTTLIVGPKDEVHRLNTKFLKARNYKKGSSYLIRCAHRRTLPTITFVLTDEDGVRQKFPISPYQYTRKVSISSHAMNAIENMYHFIFRTFLREKEAIIVRPVFKAFIWKLEKPQDGFWARYLCKCIIHCMTWNGIVLDWL